MQLTHIKRALLWIKELLITLFFFWIKNFKQTPAILKFFWKKALAFPKFLDRNVAVEKHSTNFQDALKKTKTLYRKYGKQFNPKDPRCYKRLEKILSDKWRLLYFLIRKTKPKIVVETGVAAGISTGHILKALFDNSKGKLYSIDLPFQWYVYGKNHELHLDSLPPGKLPGYLVPEDLKKNWTLILGNTYEKLPKLVAQLKRINIFLHDSEHTEKTMTFEYNAAWQKMKKGDFLLSDDVGFNKAFAKFAKQKKAKPIILNGLGIIQK